MIDKISSKPYLFLLFVFLIVFILFYPSLFVFFTHDDFFLLNISHVENLSDFLKFFDITNPPQGIGMYRPLAMQIFYYLGWKLFNLNPIGLHLISFITFFAVIFMVNKVASLFLSKGQSLLASFIYAVSSTHFMHLYFLGVYQELLVALFLLISMLFCVHYIKKANTGYFLYSYIAFIAALLSKETAVVFPLIIILVYIYLKITSENIISFKKIVFFLVPFLVTLFLYFYMRIFYYGFPRGDSYVWSISARIINTLFWYTLWSLNFPEFVLDFIGPGFKVNLEPLRYWLRYLIPLIFVILVQVALLIFLFIKKVRIDKDRTLSLLVFCIFWFLITLTPVLFLPQHKFAYYLTLPMIGMALFISYLIYIRKSWILYFFIIVWLTSSLLNLAVTRQTNWSVQGAVISKKVYDYVIGHDLSGKKILFYDSYEDTKSAWIPTNTLKTVLSDDDFFKVFADDTSVEYLNSEPKKLEENEIKLHAKDFLN